MGGKNGTFSILIDKNIIGKNKVFHPIMMRMESDPSETELENSMRSIIPEGTWQPIENDFYPIIMKMNASRRAEKGMVSMDFMLSNRKEWTNFVGQNIQYVSARQFQYQLYETTTFVTPKKIGRRHWFGSNNKQ